MAKALTLDTLTDFRAWLEQRRPLGIATSSWQVSIGDGRTGWVARLDDRETLRRALTAVELSGRKAWAQPAASVAADLARAAGLPLAGFSWLHDYGTARHGLEPEAELPDFPTSAGLASVRVARQVQDMSTADARLRATALRATRTEALWWPAQARGWRVDVKLLAEESERLRGAADLFARRLGIDLTRSSTDADAERVHRWLAERGVTLVDSSGKPSLSRDDFDTVRLEPTDAAAVAWADFKAARALLRRISKVREIERALRGDRIFSTLTFHGTVTGRTTSTGPALQNIAAELKPLLIAEQDSMLVSMDFQQVEPRVAAALSGDLNLMEDVCTSDVYLSLAEAIFGTPQVASQPDAFRAQAKTTLLALLYGLGVRRMAHRLSTTEERAREVRDAVWDRYSTLRDYVSMLTRAAERGERQHTPFGRPIAIPARPYAALNYMVQSTAADVMHAATGRVAGLIGTDALWLGIHDELVLQHPDVAEAAAALEAGMPSVLNGVPIIGTASVLGRAWKKV